MRRFLYFLLCLLLIPASACGEIRFDSEPPSDWAERQLLRVTFLQTGRSDAILVECGGEAMLIDGGDASWAKAVQRDLEGRGLSEFRYFLNTHPHNDHIEGLIFLMQQGYKPGRFMSPFAADWKEDQYHNEALQIAWDNGIPFRLVRNGDVYPLGEAEIHIFRSTAYPGLNNRSAVQLITFGDSRILLCADLTGNAQKALLSELPEGTLAAEIVKAPHHGENAMVPNFLTAASPGLIVCTSGANEAPDLTRQAGSRGIPLLFSGEGEIVLETDGTDWYAVQNPYRER